MSPLTQLRVACSRLSLLSLTSAWSMMAWCSLFLAWGEGNTRNIHSPLLHRHSTPCRHTHTHNTHMESELKGMATPWNKIQTTVSACLLHSIASHITPPQYCTQCSIAPTTPPPTTCRSMYLLLVTFLRSDNCNFSTGSYIHMYKTRVQYDHKQ